MEEEVPLSLYLRLEQGRYADLAVVSRSAIAFAELVQEMAYLLDPSVSVRVEVINASDRSFGLNTLTKLYGNIKSGVTAGAKKSPKIAWLAAYVALRIINNAVDWSQDQVMDWLAGSDAPQEVRMLTEEERKELATDIVEKLNKGAARQQSQRLFEELERDTKIDGVGVTTVAGKRPADIVPREAFSIYSDQTALLEGERRTTVQNVEATLISPVLVPGERRWKFRSATGEFGASMRDRGFMNDVLSGALDIRLKAGLVLDLELTVVEVWQEGVWVIEQRSVSDVHGWRNAPEQADLLRPGPGDVEPGDQSDEDNNRG